MKKYTVLGFDESTSESVELQVTTHHIGRVRRTMQNKHPRVQVQAVFPVIEEAASDSAIDFEQSFVHDFL